MIKDDDNNVMETNNNDDKKINHKYYFINILKLFKFEANLKNCKASFTVIII